VRCADVAMGIELLGSKVEFLLVLFAYTAYFALVQFGIYNAQIVKGAKFHLYQKN
jgi:hypothetical protein